MNRLVVPAQTGGPELVLLLDHQLALSIAIVPSLDQPSSQFGRFTWHRSITSGVHVGRDAFRRHAADYLEAFSESSFEIEHIEAVGDRILVRGRYGVGRQSGARVTVGGGVTGPASSGVYDLRAGRILRVQQFVTHVEALEAVGLSEQDPHADS